MPRGYRKNYHCGSRKESRGGSSRKQMYHRTPAFLRYHKELLRRRTHTELHCNIDAEIQDGIDNYLTDYDYGNDYDTQHIEDSEGDGEVPSEEASFNQEVRTNFPGNVSIADDETGHSFIDVDADITKRSYETIGNQDSLSFSLCEGSSQVSSESFSLISSAKCGDFDDDLSSMSSVWDIVSDTEGQEGNATIHHNCVHHRNTANNEVEDSFSLVSSQSELPQNAEVHDEDVSLRLFVPKHCAICLSEKKNVLRLMHKCNHPQACMSCLRTHYIENGVIKYYSERGNYSAEDIASHFPLKCFWPGCNRTLRDVQIRPLVKNQHEMDMYYALNQLRKGAKQEIFERDTHKSLQYRRMMNFKILQQCTYCGSTANAVHPALETAFACSQCDIEQPITVISLSDIKLIIDAVGDYIVNCPACETLIIKDGGCDHMTCVCGEDFGFSAAQSDLHKYTTIFFKKKHAG